jgi:hypothetical protein
MHHPRPPRPHRGSTACSQSLWVGQEPGTHLYPPRMTAASTQNVLRSRSCARSHSVVTKPIKPGDEEAQPACGQRHASHQRHTRRRLAPSRHTHHHQQVGRLADTMLFKELDNVLFVNTLNPEIDPDVFITSVHHQAGPVLALAQPAAERGAIGLTGVRGMAMHMVF